jgi:hypothetical protein
LVSGLSIVVRFFKYLGPKGVVAESDFVVRFFKYLGPKGVLAESELRSGEAFKVERTLSELGISVLHLLLFEFYLELVLACMSMRHFVPR